MDKLNIYTLQHENTVHELENKGRITNKEIYLKLHLGDIADFFLPRYRDFSNLANARVPKPADVAYPIWCGVSQEASFQTAPKQVLYCLSVPRDQVIFFDGRKWDYVLNSLYLPNSSADQANFQKEIQDRGISSQFGFLERYGRTYPDLAARIKDSWERIFDIQSWDEMFIQASIWEIRQEWVRHILRHGQSLAEIARDMEKTFPPDHSEG